MKHAPLNVARQVRFAKSLWRDAPSQALRRLAQLVRKHRISVEDAEVTYLDGGWYVTHQGLLEVARRNHCVGIKVHPLRALCDPLNSRWAFKAAVYTARHSQVFEGCGDANPSNVSPLMRGAEMRIAETRAVNRALRKAYGIGICSVEELGSGLDTVTGGTKFPPQRANGGGFRAQPKLRDRLLQLIRQHQLDPVLVKAYAVEFCGAKTLREATRDQVENFIQHLADWAEKDKNALLCQLNSYLQPGSGSGLGAA
jgi:hypothetical protein